MYERIKKYYALGVWSKERVKSAVEKGVITAQEYAEITGEDYVA